MHWLVYNKTFVETEMCSNMKCAEYAVRINWRWRIAGVVLQLKNCEEVTL